MTWKNITVEQYQLIHSVIKQNINEIDKTIRIIGIIYNLTEDQIYKLPYDTFLKYTDEVTHLFTIPKGEERAKRSVVAGGKRYAFDYNIGKHRFAQYIEAQHFLQGGIVENLHLIAASITRPVYCRVIRGKNDSAKHEERANDFLKANFLEVYYSVVFFCSVLSSWNGKYKGLFEISDDADDEDIMPAFDGFTKRYGWQFSAMKIKEYEGIKLQEVYEIPVIQAFNGLAFLKAKDNHEREMTKNQRNANAVTR